MRSGWFLLLYNCRKLFINLFIKKSTLIKTWVCATKVTADNFTCRQVKVTWNMSNLVRGRWNSRRVQAAEKSLEKKRKNVSRCHIKMTLYQKIIVFCSIYTEIEKKERKQNICLLPALFCMLLMTSKVAAQAWLLLLFLLLLLLSSVYHLWELH